VLAVLEVIGVIAIVAFWLVGMLALLSYFREARRIGSVFWLCFFFTLIVGLSWAALVFLRLILT
jgi:hypothetical protein